MAILRGTIVAVRCPNGKTLCDSVVSVTELGYDPAHHIISRWQYKKTAAEVIVTHVTIREVSYIAADKSFSGTLPQWLFLADFQPVTERKKKTR